MLNSKYIFFALIISLGISNSFGQTGIGSIYGNVKVLNSKSSESYTVSLLESTDSFPLRSIVTNKTGDYTFTHINFGKYIIVVSGTDITKTYTNVFTLSINRLLLPEIIISQLVTNLQAVKIVSKMPLIESKIDRIVLNVDASITNLGLNAYELLKKSPGVDVDINGNISIKGKSGVTVLINDKSIYLNGSDLADYLKNLSGNQLDKIEIMSQPSAKYEASGNGGVINFRTKKNKSRGFNGSLSSTVMFNKFSKNASAFNFNYNKNKISVFGNVSFSTYPRHIEAYSATGFREDFSSNINRYYDQNYSEKRFRNIASSKLGLDFKVSKKINFGILLDNSFGEKGDFTTGLNKIFDSSNLFDSYYTSKAQNTTPFNNRGMDFDFNLNLNKGEDISFDADYITYRSTNNQFSINNLFTSQNILVGAPYLVKGLQPSNIDIFSFKIDYSKTLKDSVSIEAGIKTSLVKTDNDAQYLNFDSSQRDWVKDYSRSNHFIYKESINSGYVNLRYEFKKWGIQLGLRAEHTKSNGYQNVNNLSFLKNYINLFPTTFISFKANANNSFGFSVGRRIERASYNDLNPFQFMWSKYNYDVGNPLLQPQFNKNFEISYNFKNVLNVALNFTPTTGIISGIDKTLKSGENYITYSTKENIASGRNSGLSITFNKHLTKWWTCNLFYSLFNNVYNGIIDNEIVNLSMTSFRIWGSNQFTFHKGWSAEVFAFYSYNDIYSTTVLKKPQGNFSIAISKQILKSKGVLKINLRDPLALEKYEANTTRNKYAAYYNTTWDNRTIDLGITFKFGNNNRQQKEKKKGAADEEGRVGN